MKKVLISVCMLILLIVLLLFKASRDNYYDTMFKKWENGEVSSEEGTDLMKSFVRHLIINPGMSTEEILNLSKQFKVYEWDNLRIIEYLENLEHYGNSAKMSFHIAINDGLVKVIESNGSKQINGYIRLNDNLYHIFMTDYKFSNMTGIDAYSILLTGKTIEFKSVMSKENLPNGFLSIDSIYYNNDHVYYKGIRDDEVLINTNDTIYTLQFKEDGLYHILKTTP